MKGLCNKVIMTNSSLGVPLKFWFTFRSPEKLISRRWVLIEKLSNYST